MKTILSCLIFLLALASFPAGAQDGLSMKRTLWVVRESGSVVFSPRDLISDEILLQKYFTYAVFLKPAGENVIHITKKYSPKPQVRIESNIGSISFFGQYRTSDELAKINPDSTCPSRSFRTRIFPNTSYGGGVNILGGVVSGIDKKAKTLKLSIYDNFTNKLLGERVFYLSPTVTHQYTTELHYTDKNGNRQIYTNETDTWIPADTTIAAKVVVMNEYGAQMEIEKFQIWSPKSMGNTYVPTFEGDELPTSSWQMREINSRNSYHITPKLKVINECDYVQPLNIRFR